MIIAGMGSKKHHFWQLFGNIPWFPRKCCLACIHSLNTEFNPDEIMRESARFGEPCFGGFGNFHDCPTCGIARVACRWSACVGHGWRVPCSFAAGGGRHTSAPHSRGSGVACKVEARRAHDLARHTTIGDGARRVVFSRLPSQGMAGVRFSGFRRAQCVRGSLPPLANDHRAHGFLSVFA